MTRQYSIVYLNNFAYMVEYGVKLKGEDQFTFTNGTPKIWAANNPSLGLPLLPKIEEIVEAPKYKRPSDMKQEGITVAEALAHVIGFTEGYKAAKAKKYTEEDIKNFEVWLFENEYRYQTNVKTWKEAIKDLVPMGIGLWYKPGMSVGGKKTSDLFSEYVKSLSPLPIAVEVEINEIRGNVDPSTNGGIGDKYIEIPKVDENNTIIVKKWIWDK